MNIATDIILIVICAATVIKYTVKGLAKTVLDIIAFVASTVAAFILTPLIFGESSFLTRMIANILIFLSVYVVLKVVFSVVNKLFKLPIIGAINTFLGFLLGLLCAYILGSFITSVLTVVVYTLNDAADIANSFMYKFFSEYGAFALIDKLFIN